MRKGRANLLPDGPQTQLAPGGWQINYDDDDNEDDDDYDDDFRDEDDDNSVFSSSQGISN